MALQKETQRYTYADYCVWDDGERWELIDGVPYMMSPAPSRVHQSISGQLYGQLFNFLKDKPCKVYHAPFDVRLNIDKEDDTIVQPDLLVVCDESKLDDKGCKGAPDMVIEIVSPSTAQHDKVLKFNKYLQVGVREYWIVDPDSKTVTVHVLEHGNYITNAYGDTDAAPIHVLKGCTIHFQDVFAE